MVNEVGTDAVLESALAAASAIAGHLAESEPSERARWLRSAAGALDDASDELVVLAADETHLGLERLRGELVRTTFQLRLFADLVETGGHLDARVDHADPSWPMGARPDLRRMLRPLGPAAVYAASNFPFAFSVAGGDTAAALAAGCPVVVKAHPGHPRLSRAVASAVSVALEQAGAPAGVFALVEGVETGRALVVDPRITVATFTGSLAGGRALFDLAASRPEPIPFYGELGSVNPVFVTTGAAAARRDAIAAGFAASVTLGVGQFCTKPGVLLVPVGDDLERLVVDAMADAGGGVMLSERIRDGFLGGLGVLADHSGVEVLVPPHGAGGVSPVLYGTDAATLLASPVELLQEHFGPAALVVRYRDDDELLRVAKAVEGQLTATVHGEEGEGAASALLDVLAGKAGRVLWNAWPTGVSVTYAMQHGGPYPATTAPHFTSVGTASIERFLRPVAYQGVPDALLPAPLQEANPWGVPRLVDGVRAPVA